MKETTPELSGWILFIWQDVRQQESCIFIRRTSFIETWRQEICCWMANWLVGTTPLPPTTQQNYSYKTLPVHVADFGLARIKRQTYAQTNGNLGSIKWLAPEGMFLKREDGNWRVNGLLLLAITQQYSESSDVYSFGVVLWELLTRGKEPYPGEEILAIALAVTREKRRPPIPPDCPPVWRDLMQRCWAHEPMDRPTFEEIWQVLDKYWKSLKQEANAEGSKVIRGSKHRHKKHSHSKQSRASPKGSKATQKKTKD